MVLPAYLYLALDELGSGVKELTGAPSNPRIEEYLATVGQAADDDIPWCAAFMNWLCVSTGLKGTNKANARSFLDWGDSILTPQLGCVAVLKRGTQEWQGHVGIWLDASSSRVTLLGGNQSNRVSIGRYPLSDVLGYRVPRRD